MKRGTFVVIEGGDGTGKETQTNLLHSRARQEGYRVVKTSFPNYDTPTGEEIHRYLDTKEYGELRQVDPKLASLLFIIDRHEAQSWMERMLRRVDLFIADRYSISNFAYQTARLQPGPDREAMLTWLHRFEHETPFQHPFPDKIIYLDLPPAVSAEAMKKEGRKLDIHEENPDYQQRVREEFLALAATDRGGRWKMINCMNEEQGIRFTEGELTDKIWGIVSPLLTKTPPHIYFSFSISNPTNDEEVRKQQSEATQRMAAVLRTYGQIMTEHLLEPNCKEKEDQRRRMEGTNVYERDMEWLSHANILVADVTFPSHGVGREIERAAEMLKIPVILFYNNDIPQIRVSNMLLDDVHLAIKPYTLQNLEDVVHATMQQVVLY